MSYSTDVKDVLFLAPVLLRQIKSNELRKVECDQLAPGTLVELTESGIGPLWVCKMLVND